MSAAIGYPVCHHLCVVLLGSNLPQGPGACYPGTYERAWTFVLVLLLWRLWFKELSPGSALKTYCGPLPDDAHTTSSGQVINMMELQAHQLLAWHTNPDPMEDSWGGRDFPLLVKHYYA